MIIQCIIREEIFSEKKILGGKIWSGAGRKGKIMFIEYLLYTWHNVRHFHVLLLFILRTIGELFPFAD